jgi:hypothetical protein
MPPGRCRRGCGGREQETAGIVEEKARQINVWRAFLSFATLLRPTSAVPTQKKESVFEVSSSMWCPRCKSTRVQRGYNDSAFVFQLAGLQELLCNNCGLEFKGFDPLRRFQRKPSPQRETTSSRRRFPRFKVRLPATIALVERNPVTWDVSYSASSRGQCETLSQGGMALAFVGSRFPAEQLTRPGCQLYVTVNLPAAIIAAVVSTITCDRIGPRNQKKWFVGTAITQMSDSDAAKLVAYLNKQVASEPLVLYG